MAYEGGYTSAVNSQAQRAYQEATTRKYLQEIAMQQQLFQEQEQARQRALSARAGAGRDILALGGQMPGSGPPNPQSGMLPPPPPMPQPPPPGQQSQPMMPPMPQQAMGAPGGIPPPPTAMPQNSRMGPPAEPMPAAMSPQWQQMPKGPPTQAQQAPQGIPPPPAAPQQPATPEPGAMNIRALATQWKQEGVPLDQVMDRLEALTPFMTMQNKTELDDVKLKLQFRKELAEEAQKIAARLQKEKVDAETARHHGALEKNAQQRVDIHIGDAASKRAADADNDLAKDADTRKWMAEQYWAGDKSVLQNLGRGAQGAKNITALRKEIAAIGKEKGQTPKDLAAAMAEFEGLKAGERTLGTRSANIEMAGTEADKLADLASKASGEWNRTGIKSLNDLEKYAQGRSSSPELRRFVAANTSFINAYARAINPQGVGTVADKEHAREMLEVGFSKGDYAAAIDQLKSEIGVAKSAPGDVKVAMRKRFTGSDDAAASPKAGTVQDGYKFKGGDPAKKENWEKV